MPLTTTWTRSLVSKCGWAFDSVTRPCVAQRVCPMPLVAGCSATATATATPPSSRGFEPGLPCATASRSLLRLPTARTEAISPPVRTDTPAES